MDYTLFKWEIKKKKMQKYIVGWDNLKIFFPGTTEPEKLRFR
jgi:hypothetical protein